MHEHEINRKLDLLLGNQVKIMDDIAAAVAAMNEAAAVLQAHVVASAEPVDLSGLRDATGALNAVLHPANEPTPAEITVPDPPEVNEQPGPDIIPAAF